jgi:Kef-type K+ transport system membrane component KefB
VTTLSALDLAHILLALALLLVAAHVCGHVFAHFHQPRVIGEIVGGLLLGPTLLGAISSTLEGRIFPSAGTAPVVLDAIYQLGLLLLMFAAGAEMRMNFGADERRSVVTIGSLGIVVPFAAGAIAVGVLGLSSWMGPAATRGSFVLVFSIAVAVTSIPVISRIMLDLGIIDTSFARVVLGVAVIEDVVLYVLLAIALGLVAKTGSSQVGLPAILGIDPASGLSIAYHVVATLGFLVVSLVAGPPLYRRALRFRYNFVQRANPVAFQLALMLSMTLVAVFLGVVPLYGAFLAGIVVGAVGGPHAEQAREAIKTFSFGFFVPIYFAIVGVRLDLVHDLQPLAFLAFFLFACAAKALSVYVGGRLARESHRGALNLAVALNARGGPGIVLASVAFDAAIITGKFYATLVLLAIVTSLAAGAWLERATRSEQPLR